MKYLNLNIRNVLITCRLMIWLSHHADILNKKTCLCDMACSAHIILAFMA